MSFILTDGKFHGETDTGAPGVGFRLWTYASGTTTPKATYSDAALTIPNTNPIILNARGEANVFLGEGAYSLALQTAQGVVVWTQDGVSSSVDDIEDLRDELNGNLATFTASLVSSVYGNKGAALVGFGPDLVYAAHTAGFKLAEVVSVRDYGARGDGLGKTPADEGVDITNEPWNTWEGLPFKTNPDYSPYATGGSFVPPTPKPFQNNDTWDYIGCQRALNLHRSVFVPPGRYKINMSNPRGSFNGLMTMRGQECTLYGAGNYQSIIQPKESPAFFEANYKGVQGYYGLLILYRPSGIPSQIRSLGLMGPEGYAETSLNLTLIRASNINGVTLTDLWMSACGDAVSLDYTSNDNHMSAVTTEFCFGASVRQNADSYINIGFCDFWASTTVPTQKGIVSAGNVTCNNSLFVGFRGGAVTALNGQFVGNTVTCDGGDGVQVSINSNATIVGNNINGSPNSSLVQVIRDSTLIGNSLGCTSEHACLSFGNGSVGSAQNINVVGNSFVNPSVAAGAQNYLIVAPVTGVDYTGAASPTLSIMGNNFQGRTQDPLGTANFKLNTINGVMQAAVFNEFAAFKGGLSATLANYANDAAAATGGIAIGSMYRNGSVVQVRVA